MNLTLQLRAQRETSPAFIRIFQFSIFESVDETGIPSRPKGKLSQTFKRSFVEAATSLSHLIYALTARAVAPTDDFATSFLHFPCSPLPSGTW